MSSGSTSTELKQPLDNSALPIELAEASLSECALTVCINGISQAVMMVSDKDLLDFGLGFALSEGLLTSAADVIDMELSQQGDHYQLDIRVLAQLEVQLKQRRRAMAGPSGCGLCGLESLEQSMDLAALTKLVLGYIPAESDLLAAADELAHQQRLHNFTRGHHSAACFTPELELLAHSEDVGRHSALDKLIGRLAQQDQLSVPSFVVLTSRCSFDLVVKVLRLQFSCLFTLAPPTQLAVKTAREFNLALFCLQQGELKRFA